MKGEGRERWLQLCIEAADQQDSDRLLELISEINHLLHDKHMRLRNVRREPGGYILEAAEQKTRHVRVRSLRSG